MDNWQIAKIEEHHLGETKPDREECVLWRATNTLERYMRTLFQEQLIDVLKSRTRP